MTIPRERRPRRIDDPKLTDAELRVASAGFERLSRSNRVAGKIVGNLKGYAEPLGDLPLHVLNLGSGVDDLIFRWAGRIKLAGLPVEIVSFERDEVSFQRQQACAHSAGVDIHFQLRDYLHGGLPHGFDVIICTQLMHRLDDPQACRLIQSMQLAAEVAVMISDYERSTTNAALLSLASRIVSRSPVVHADASASVRGSYTLSEMSDLAQRALARPVNGNSVAPFYYLITIDELVVPVPVPAFA